MPDSLSHSPAPSTAERRPFRTRVLPGLWLLFLILTAGGAISNAVTFFRTLADTPTEYGFSLVGPLAGPLALDVWSLISGLLFGLVVRNRGGWGNGRRFAIGGILLVMMLGRLAGGGLLGIGLDFLAVQPWVAVIVAPMALLSGGFALVVVVTAIVFTLFTAFVAVPAFVFTQVLTFENMLHVYRHQTRGLTGYLVRFNYWLRGEVLPPPPPDDSRGARFSTGQEVVQLHQAGDPAAMAFGHLGNPLMLKTDKHILIMASTRSGKGVTLIIPHLLRYPGSAFVLDPKGENAKATGRRRGQLNISVHYLDPFGISGKRQSRFNPLSRFTAANMEAESKALAAALFVVGDGERDHWTASAQQLVAAIILFVFVSDKVAPAEKSLPTMRRILLGGLKPALEEMVTLDDADGLLRDLAMSFLETPEKELGSIISTAQRQTEILDNPYITACLAASGPAPEVDFKAWRRGTMTVFLCLSAPKFPVFNRWLRLVLTSALDEMTDTLDPPKLPVCFMLDELATLGHLAPVENAVGLAAGYGIQLVTVFQDIAQMRSLYKGRWASFIGNAGIRALFNLDDYDTADYWSKFIGGRIMASYSRQEDLYGLSSGQNVSEALRALVPPEKLMLDYAADKMLVLAQGAHPIVTDRVPYWQDQYLAGLWDDPRQAWAKPASSSRSQHAAQPREPAASTAPPAPAKPRRYITALEPPEMTAWKPDTVIVNGFPTVEDPG